MSHPGGRKQKGLCDISLQFVRSMARVCAGIRVNMLGYQIWTPNFIMTKLTEYSETWCSVLCLCVCVCAQEFVAASSTLHKSDIFFSLTAACGGPRNSSAHIATLKLSPSLTPPPLHCPVWKPQAPPTFSKVSPYFFPIFIFLNARRTKKGGKQMKGSRPEKQRSQEYNRGSSPQACWKGIMDCEKRFLEEASESARGRMNEWMRVTWSWADVNTLLGRAKYFMMKGPSLRMKFLNFSIRALFPLKKLV